MRSYYSNSLTGFINDNEAKILGDLALSHNHALEDLQKNAWIDQIRMLKLELSDIEHLYIYFEFSIPRMGKRVDNIILHGGRIYVLEYKVGATKFEQHALDQVMDYALDLASFHETSHNLEIVPVLIASGTDSQDIQIREGLGLVYQPVCISKGQISELFQHFPNISPINPSVWSEGIYKPTPTIIEAAQAMFQGHNVQDISRSDGGTINLARTMINEKQQ